MPVEARSVEEFERVLDAAVECRVKLGERRVRTEEGTKRVRVLKVKARTPRKLYTLVFEDVDKGIDYVKKIKERCKELGVLDEELEGKI